MPFSSIYKKLGSIEAFWNSWQDRVDWDLDLHVCILLLNCSNKHSIVYLPVLQPVYHVWYILVSCHSIPAFHPDWKTLYHMCLLVLELLKGAEGKQGIVTLSTPPPSTSRIEGPYYVEWFFWQKLALGFLDVVVFWYTSDVLLPTDNDRSHHRLH